MTDRGTVQAGVVHLEPDAKLPDGIEVRVEPVEEPASNVFQKLARLAGRTKKLPPDPTRDHDHDLHDAHARAGSDQFRDQTQDCPDQTDDRRRPARRG